MRNPLLCLVACWLILPATAPAQETQPGQPSREELARRFVALNSELGEHIKAGNYEKAAESCRKMIEIAPRHPSPRYNLACALARLGRTDDALAALEAAVERGFFDTGHAQEDPDLESLRTDARFAAILKKAPREKGREIKGVKTMEGDPAGGLAYRLRLSPEAGAGKPQRLIVWLHPSGGSMNSTVEAMSPELVKRGFALLVLTRKSFAGWSEADAQRLIAKTLPEVAKIEGLDASRPILMGYSAGGQMALNLWDAKPGDFGGLVLDAAYPIDAKAYAAGKVQAQAVPTDEAYRKTPIFALVGDKDGGARLWKRVAPEWDKQGVPLTLGLVPGQGHTWLFGKAQTQALLTWLQAVKDGQLPRDVTAASATQPAGK